ncbi:MAG: prepilin peptidase [Candidatus Latescibacterota bacterium]|nr:MAG: prepilin peptidase [Candidatus Latescibacterota bacterium]
MSHTPYSLWYIVLTIVVVVLAVIMDLLWRRIPNLLTFPAFFVAIVVRIFFQGWVGLALGLAGALLAPTLLFLMHGGKGIGMGDLKLAAVIGAILGPVMAVVTILFTAVAGGLLAIVMMLRPGGMLAQLLSTFLIGLPFRKKNKKEADPPVEDKSPACATMPYGVAIGVGSLMTLAVYWWTGNENWFLTFAGIAASQ